MVEVQQQAFAPVEKSEAEPVVDEGECRAKSEVDNAEPNLALWTTSQRRVMNSGSCGRCSRRGWDRSDAVRAAMSRLVFPSSLTSS